MLNDIFYWIVGAIAFYFSIQNYKRQKEEKLECKFLEEIEWFIQRVKQFYIVNPMIEEAVYDGMCESNGRMAKEAQYLYEMLVDGRDEVRRSYMKTQKNSFLKLFASLLCIEMQYGSQQKDAVFLEGIGLLRQDLILEIWKRKEIRVLFSGLSFLILFPAFFLKPIELWATSNIPELMTSYHGMYGKLIVLFFFLLMGLSYWGVWQLRTSMEEKEWIEKRTNGNRLLEKIEHIGGIAWVIEIWEKRNYIGYQKYQENLQRAKEKITPEQFFIKKILWGIICFLLAIGLCLILQNAKKMQALEGTELLDRQILSYVGIPFEQWQKGMKEIGKEYREKEWDEEVIVQRVSSFYHRQNLTLVKMAIEQLKQNQEQYQKTRLPILWWLSSIFFLFFGWKLPDIFCMYRCWKYEQYREYELDYYETILLSLSKSESVDSVTVIEYMEEGSDIYENVWGKSLLSVYIGELHMVEQLKEQGRHIRLQQIANDLVFSDQVGMKKAFEDYLIHRKNQQERRRQENEILVKKRGLFAKSIAFVPLFFEISMYLIVPVVLESMVQLSSFLEQIK